MPLVGPRPSSRPERSTPRRGLGASGSSGCPRTRLQTTATAAGRSGSRRPAPGPTGPSSRVTQRGRESRWSRTRRRPRPSATETRCGRAVTCRAPRVRRPRSPTRRSGTAERGGTSRGPTLHGDKTGNVEEEFVDDRVEVRDARRAVDPHTQVRAVVEAFRIPSAQRAQLVDHPPLAAARGGRAWRWCLEGSRRNVPEARRFADALVAEQADVVEQKLAALATRHLTRRPTLPDVGRLRENPRVAQDPPADEDTADRTADASRRRARVGAKPGEYLLRLDAVAAAEHGNRQVTGHARDQVPVRAAAVGLRGGASVDGHRGRAGVPAPFSRAPGRCDPRRSTPPASSR